MNKKCQARCIAHEIRNQISICELYSQIIKRNLESEGIKNKSIDNALNCISKSIKVVNNCLLDLKSLDNIETKLFDACEIVKEAINLCFAYVQNKDINISLSCENSEKIKVDENKFLACIVNIIKNAIEAIEEKGEILVKISTNEEKVFINISNNGPAIPKNIQKHLFDEGFTTKQTGSGLGLAICADSLKSQNADLKLVKSTSKTTEFEISVPIDR